MGLKELVEELDVVRLLVRERERELANANRVFEAAQAAYLSVTSRESDIIEALRALAAKESQRPAPAKRGGKPGRKPGLSFQAVVAALDHEPRRMSEIAALASVPTSSVQSALRRLESEGLATRDEQLRWRRREPAVETGAES